MRQSVAIALLDPGQEPSQAWIFGGTPQKPGAGEANRTPDPNLGKVMLYP